MKIRKFARARVVVDPANEGNIGS